VCFSSRPVSKKCRNYTFYVWRAVWCLPTGLGRWLAQNFGGFLFSSKKSAPANRKKGFYTSRLPKNDEIRGIFVEAAKNFESCSIIQPNLKI
jgi:hypothetical protein